LSIIGFTATTKFEAKLGLLMGSGVVDSTAAARRLQNAYDTIVSRLVERGLSLAVVNTWKRGEEFQLDIATYWYGCDKGWMRQQRDEKDWLTVFNREKELATVPLIKTDFTSLSAGGDVAAAVWNIEDRRCR
jgi:hypothetical protein